MASDAPPQPASAGGPRPSLLAPPLLLLAGACWVGLAEGVRDLSGLGGHPLAGTRLLYAVLSWGLPVLACGLLAGLCVLPVAWLRRGRAAGPASAAGVAWAGLTAGLAAGLLDRGGGAGLPRAAAVGLGAAVVVALVFTVALRWLGPRRWLPAAAGLLLVLPGLLAPLVGGALLPDQGSVPRPRTDGPPVVLIVADALRADALGCYGGATPTPHLDALAARGWRVPDVLSTSSWTLPGVASLWSGRLPGRHGVRTAAGVLDDAVPVLAEQLQRAGYRTGAVLANPILDPLRGFGRGFHRLSDDTHVFEASLFWVVRLNRLARELGWLSGPNAGRKLTVPVWTADGLQARRTGYAAGDEVTDAALRLVDELGPEGLFLYVHYFDPHDPYLPHPTPVLWHEPPTEPEHLEALRADYAGEVAFLDAQVGRLLEGLAARGVEDPLVVFTADHGEEFLDHGGWRHWATLYDELVRLPLLVAFPRGASPGPAPAAASLADVTPTLLATLGVPPLEGSQGRDLREAAPPPPRQADRIEEGNWLAAVRTGGRHWIFQLPPEEAPDPATARAWRAALEAGGAEAQGVLGRFRAEAYELASDPAQQTDVAARHPDALRAALALVLEEMGAGREAAERTLDEAELDRLRAMGYLR